RRRDYIDRNTATAIAVRAKIAFLTTLMQRRAFLLSGLAPAVWAAAPRNLKITAVKVIVTNPARAALANYVLVKLETNQPGLWGWGDCTCTGSELGVAKFLEEHMTPGLMGRNPMQLEDLWQ